jgi:hypothetical protein
MAFDIGCIECGEPSGIVGFFATKEEASAALDAAEKKQQADWIGQHAFRIFDLESESSFSEWSK